MAPLPGSPKRPLQGALLQPVKVAHLRRGQRLRQCVELHDAEPRTRAERKSQVRQCLVFCTADFWFSLAYESAEQKPKHCLTPGFLIPLTVSHTIFFLFFVILRKINNAQEEGDSVVPQSRGPTLCGIPGTLYSAIHTDCRNVLLQLSLKILRACLGSR